MTSTLPRSQRRISRDSGKRKPKSNNRLRVASRYLFLAVLIIAPWTFGAVYFQTQRYLYAALLMTGLMWLVSHLCETSPGPSRYHMPVLILPVALGVIFGSVQLTPLITFEHQHLGPAVSQDLPIDSEIAGFERQFVSIYPLQTRVTIASLSIALLTFFLASQLFSNRKSQLMLFGVIALSGLALSFFGLAQKLSWNGHLFWRGPEVIDGQPFSAWVNRNNAAGFLNMTLAASLGMLVWSTFHKTTRNAFEYDLLNDGLEGGFRERIHGYIARLGRLRGSQMLFGLSTIVIASGVIASSSRGGILSLGAGASSALIWLILKGEKRLAGALCLILLIPTMGLITFLGISGSVSSRFEELGAFNFEHNARYQNWSDTLHALPDIWVAGSGLGTYRYLYRPYQRHGSEGLYQHAENQYVETLIEGGAVGLGLLVAAILLGYGFTLRLSRSRAIKRDDGIALVALVALTTQCCHAFVDFGLTLPANMLLMAAIMGAASGRASCKLAGARRSWWITFPRMHSKVTPALFAVLLIGNGTLGWLEISRGAVAESALRYGHREDEHLQPAEASRRQLDRLLAALPHRPDDAELLLAISENYERSYRLAVEKQLEPLQLSDRELNSRTSLASLYLQASEYERQDKRFELEHLKANSAIQETLIPARSVLLAAEAACEWQPQVQLRLAFLSVLAEPLSQRRERLERIIYLAPYEPQYLYPTGYLARADGNDELCLFAWKRAFKLSPQLRYEILLAMQHFYPDISLGEDFLPRDPTVLRQTIEYPTILKGHPEIVEQCLICVDEMFAEDVAFTADVLFLDGFRKERRGQWQDAITSYESAIRINPGDLSARIRTIELLIEHNELEKAELQLAHAKVYMASYDEPRRLELLIEEAREVAEGPIEAPAAAGSVE